MLTLSPLLIRHRNLIQCPNLRFDHLLEPITLSWCQSEREKERRVDFFLLLFLSFFAMHFRLNGVTLNAEATKTKAFGDRQQRTDSKSEGRSEAEESPRGKLVQYAYIINTRQP